jgi:hypothetical protein
MGDADSPVTGTVPTGRQKDYPDKSKETFSHIVCSPVTGLTPVRRFQVFEHKKKNKKYHRVTCV